MNSLIDVHIGNIARKEDGRAEVTLRVRGDPESLTECGNALIQSGVVAYRRGAEAKVNVPAGRNVSDALREIRALITVNRENIDKLFEHLAR